MAENRNCKNDVRIPAGWARKGEGYYCPETEQEFKTLDKLIGYVTYAKVFQPELFDSWSENKSTCQKKRGRTTEVVEGVTLPQKKRGQARKGASSSTSPVDLEGGEGQSRENLCPELGGCEQGTSSGKPDTVYERRCKFAAKKETKA